MIFSFIFVKSPSKDAFYSFMAGIFDKEEKHLIYRIGFYEEYLVQFQLGINSIDLDTFLES